MPSWRTTWKMARSGSRAITEARLEQRMGTDKQLRRSVSRSGIGLLAGALAQTARQPHHLDAQRLKPALKGIAVLLGQQFGRRHHGNLMTMRDGSQCCCSRDYGLAAAHVALHQPHHRMGLGEIGVDIGEGRHLPPVRLKPSLRVKRSRKLLADPSVAGKAMAWSSRARSRIWRRLR